MNLLQQNPHSGCHLIQVDCILDRIKWFKHVWCNVANINWYQLPKLRQTLVVLFLRLRDDNGCIGLCLLRLDKDVWALLWGADTKHSEFDGGKAGAVSSDAFYLRWNVVLCSVVESDWPCNATACEKVSSLFLLWRSFHAWCRCIYFRCRFCGFLYVA